MANFKTSDIAESEKLQRKGHAVIHITNEDNKTVHVFNFDEKNYPAEKDPVTTIKPEVKSEVKQASQIAEKKTIADKIRKIIKKKKNKI